MTSGPLGRDSMAFREKMKKYHGEIERLVYAAEILCDSCEDDKCEVCPFQNDIYCAIAQIRQYVGDPVTQHDLVPCDPCQPHQQQGGVSIH